MSEVRTVNKFIPYEKLPKRRQREIDREKRGSWGAISPVTRKPAKSTAYDRTKENRRWKTDNGHGDGFLRFGTCRL